MTATDPRLEEIEARLSRATPGPWEVRSESPSMDGGNVTFRREGKPGIIISAHMYRHGYDDAEFIAAAPADVAYLLAELRKAQDKLARVEALANTPDQTLVKPKGDKVFYVEAHRISAAVADATGGAA